MLNSKKGVDIYISNIEFFQKDGYGMMMHFGLYSLLGGEYKGVYGNNYENGYRRILLFLTRNMKKLASIFNPIYFDADEIIKFANACAKHDVKLGFYYSQDLD